MQPPEALNMTIRLEHRIKTGGPQAQKRNRNLLVYTRVGNSTEFLLLID